MRLVLANAETIDYPTGGGHLSVRLQYMLALQELNVDWYLIQVLRAGEDAAVDEQLVSTFFRELGKYGLDSRIVVVRYHEEMDLAGAQVYGMSKANVEGLIRDADIAWNFTCGLRDPLLSRFKRTAVIDLDPGVIHHSGLMFSDLGIVEADIRFTVGLCQNDEDCLTPDLGVSWIPFLPPIYLPLWDTGPIPPSNPTFSTVTHWTWGEQMPVEGRLVSTSKRDAYLRYIRMPEVIEQPFELAVYIKPEDADGELLRRYGWSLVNPHVVAANPALYRDYIRSSKAEFSCPKPIFRELKTGWFSDRSAAYLASGRPVLAEDTGYSEHLPTGSGLLSFTNIEEAVEGVKRINADYEAHCRAAREFAVEHLDGTKIVRSMLEAC